MRWYYIFESSEQKHGRPAAALLHRVARRSLACPPRRRARRFREPELHSLAPLPPLLSPARSPLALSLYSRSQSPLAGHGKQPRARRRCAARRPGAAAALAAAVRGCASPPRRSRDSSPLPPAVSVTMAATTGAAVRRRLLCSWSGHLGQAFAERSSPTRVRGSPVLPHYSSPSIAASPAGFREPRRPPCSKSRQGPPTKIRRKSGF